MNVRMIDGLVAGLVVLGLIWAWPSGEPEPPDEAPALAIQRTERVRAPLPTRTQPDRFARAETRDVRPAHLVLPTARGLTDAPRIRLTLFEHDGRVPEPAMIYSPDCGISHLARDGVVALQLPPGTCTFIGQRPSGLLLHQTEPLVVTLASGDDWDEALTFPPGETGGLGASLSRHPAGVRLASVMPGMGADDAGLMTGDVVVAIEGVPVQEMKLDEVVRQLTGRVGSLVDLDVWDPHDPDGGTLTARVRRTYLPEEDPES